MVLDVIFGPFLNFHPVLAVTIFSIIVLILINIFYKVLVDQNEAKRIKERQQELSRKMREEQKAGNSKSSNELMGEVLKENSKLMKLTLKPMLVSFIIVVIMLPWLHQNYGDIDIQVPNNQSTSAMMFRGIDYPFSLENEAIRANGYYCAMPCEITINGQLFEVTKQGSNGNIKVRFAPVVAKSPIPLPLTGTNVGWLMWYVVVSIPFVIIIRKMMKIYV